MIFLPTPFPVFTLLDSDGLFRYDLDVSRVWDGAVDAASYAALAFAAFAGSRPLGVELSRVKDEGNDDGDDQGDDSEEINLRLTLDGGDR